MNTRRDTGLLIVGILVSGVFMWLNKQEYEHGAWFNDTLFPFIAFVCIFLLIVERQGVYGILFAQKCITVRDAFTIRNKTPAFRIPAVYNLNGEVICPELSVFRRNGWLIFIKVWSNGGKRKGYLVIPSTLVAEIGKHIFANVKHIKKYVGADGHKLLYPHVYDALKNYFEDKEDGWSDSFPVYFGYAVLYEGLGLSNQTVDSSGMEEYLSAKVDYLEADNKKLRTQLTQKESSEDKRSFLDKFYDKRVETFKDNEMEP